MSIRSQIDFAQELGVRVSKVAIETEIVAEKASSLGHHGRMVEKSMAALNAAGDFDGDARRALVDAAAYQVWCYLVQREMCGMRDHRDVIRFYGVPPEVLNRMGAVTTMPAQK